MVYEGNNFFRPKLQNVWKKINEKPFKNNKNCKRKFVWYMRGITFLTVFRHGYFFKNAEKRRKINQKYKCKFVKYMRGWTFVFHFFHKICRISEEKSAEIHVNTRKIGDANSSGIWGKKLFLCTKVHKNCRMSEKISALKYNTSLWISRQIFLYCAEFSFYWTSCKP